MFGMIFCSILFATVCWFGVEFADYVLQEEIHYPLKFYVFLGMGCFLVRLIVKLVGE